MAVGYGNDGQQRNQQSSGHQAGSRPEGWDAIKDDVGGIAEAAVDRGRDFLQSARSQATGYVDQRKNDAAESVSDLARSLRDACAQFDDRPNIRAFVDSAADGLDQFADSIRARSFNEIFEDVEDLVRRRPAMVGAASLLTGFFLSRFIKASAQNIREAEMERRAGNGAGRSGRARAQASPGSSYARSGA
jgi:hypothetical protein